LLWLGCAVLHTVESNFSHSISMINPLGKTGIANLAHYDERGDADWSDQPSKRGG
jgi:hypothetical protein